MDELDEQKIVLEAQIELLKQLMKIDKNDLEKSILVGHDYAVEELEHILIMIG